MNFAAFNRYFVKIALVYLVGIVLFMFFRILIMVNFGTYADLHPYIKDVFNAYLVGLRYDTVVLNYGLIVPMLFLLALLFVPSRFRGLEVFANKFLFYFSFLVIFLFLWVLIVDFYFYKFFQNHLNLLAFGIKDDDTKAVLRSVWTDYPVIRILLAIGAFFLLLRYVLKRVKKLNWAFPIEKLWIKIAFPIICLVSYGIGMRGSLGTFPIEKDDAVISANNFVNTLTMNGVFSLKDAFADKVNFQIDVDIEKTMSRYGFKSPQEAVSIYLDIPVSGIAPEKLMIDTTASDEFLKNHPLNVVFVMMESMSNYYLDLHSSQLNLLGSLEDVLPDCFVFRNFMSCCNGTIHSLEGLLVNTPLTPISQSKYMGVSLPSSVALPFLKNGYETNFVTGAKLGWRNLDKYIVKQYFQHAEGSAALFANVPGAAACEWGVFDQYMFDRMHQILKGANGKPQFIFGFSTTNHTPYELPEGYKPYSVVIPDSIRKVLRCNEDIAQKNLTNYQYANDCIGKFIKQLKNSPYGENTMVVITGDHNSLALFDFPDQKLLQKLSVPLIMYIPEKYRKGIFDPNRFGSHKDIFPTIFNLALSKTPYEKSGNFLFTKDSLSTFYGVNDYKVGMSKDGCVIAQEKPLFYRWEKGKSLSPVTGAPSPELEKLLLKVRSHAASLTYFIQKQL